MTERTEPYKRKMGESGMKGELQWKRVVIGIACLAGHEPFGKQLGGD